MNRRVQVLQWHRKMVEKRNTVLKTHAEYVQFRRVNFLFKKKNSLKLKESFANFSAASSAVINLTTAAQHCDCQRQKSHWLKVKWINMSNNEQRG